VSESGVWPNGSIYWDDVYGCGWYQAVATYKGLTGKSPHPSYQC
jgi:hypothetical protein